MAVEAYADLVPHMRELRGGGKTLRAVADALNAEGHTTRTGKAWGPPQVKRVLDRSPPDGQGGAVGTDAGC